MDDIGQHGMQTGCEVGNRGEARRSDVNALGATVVNVGFAGDQATRFGTVEHARDVARAELQPTAQFDGAESVTWCKRETDEEIECGGVVRPAGDSFSFDRSAERDLSSEERARRTEQVGVERSGVGCIGHIWNIS